MQEFYSERARNADWSTAPSHEKSAMRRYWLFILVMLFRGSAGVEVPASEKIHLSAQIRKGMNLPDASARFLIIGFSLTKESPPRVSA